MLPQRVRLQDDTDQKKKIPTQQIKRMKITEPKKAHIDGTTGEITAESDWTPVGG